MLTIRLTLAAIGISWLAIAQAQTNLIPVWTTNLGGVGKARHGAAVGTDGTIYIVIDNGVLYALNPDGTRKWIYIGGGGAATPPSIGPNGMVYYASRGGADGITHFQGVNPDGTKGFQKDWPEVVLGWASVAGNGRMLVTIQAGTLYEFEPAGVQRILTTGDALWAARDDISTPVVAADGTLLYGGGSGRLQGLTPEGKSKWNFAAAAYLSGVSVGPEGIIYISLVYFVTGAQTPSGGMLFALNPDGSQRWSMQGPTEFRMAPAVGGDGTVYLPATLSAGSTETGQLLRINSAGQVLGTNFFDGAVNSTPALAQDGTVWVTDLSGKLSVVSTNGQLLAEYRADKLGAPPVITPEGRVIVTTQLRDVLAFQGAPAATNGWPMAGRDAQRTHHDTTAAPPAPPISLNATTNLNSGILLAWTPAANNPATFEVWRAATTNAAEASLVAAFLANDYRFLDTNVVASTLYYYWVRARNGFGNSAFAGPVSGVRPFPAVGGEIWHYRQPDFQWRGLAVGLDGTIYLAGNHPGTDNYGTNSTRLVALSSNGEERWLQGGIQRFAGPPVLGFSNEVLVTTLPYGDTGNEVVVLNADGVIQGRAPNPSMSPPVIGPEGELYLATLPGTLNAIPPLLSDKGRLWQGTGTGVELSHAGKARVWLNGNLGGYPVGLAPAPQGGVYWVNVTGLGILQLDGTFQRLLVSSNLTSTPILARDGTIYVGTATNSLLAIDGTGQMLWTADADGAVTLPAIVGQDGGIFFGTSAGTLHAVNADGSPRWQFYAGGGISTPPTLTPSGQIVFGTENGLVWCLRADTTLAATAWPKYQGNLANQGRAEGESPSLVAPTNVIAQVNNPGGTVIHVSWDSVPGATSYDVWRAVGADFTQAQPVMTNISMDLHYDDDLTRYGVVYSYWVCGVNELGRGPFASPVSHSQTNMLWGLPLGTGYVSAPTVAEDGTIFIVNDDFIAGHNTHSLYAINPDGSIAWVKAFPYTLFTAPVICPNSNLVFATSEQNGSFQAVDRRGEIKWTTTIGLLGYGDPAVDLNGTMYFATLGSSANYLYAISADGVVLWKTLTGNTRDHPVIGADGSVSICAGATLFGLEPWGNIRWRAQTRSGNNWSTPAVNQAGEWVTVPTGGQTSSLVRIASDGTVLASNVVSVPRLGPLFPYAEPAVAADGSVYFLSYQSLVAIHSNGIPQWTNTVRHYSGYLGGVPALDQAGNVYVATLTNVQAFDRQGQAIAQWELGGASQASPILTEDGRIYMAAAKYRLYAFPALAGLDASAPWPMYRHDPQGTSRRQAPLEPPKKPVLADAQPPFANKVRINIKPTNIPITLEMYRNSTTNLDTALQVADGLAGQLYVEDTTGQPGVLYYYWIRSRHSGGISDWIGPIPMIAVAASLRGFLEIADATTSLPAIGPTGALYTAATNGLLALNPDGSIRWQLPGLVGRPAVAPNGAILLRSSDVLFSIGSTGATNWTLARCKVSTLPPAIGADGTIFMLNDNQEIMAITGDGVIQWKAPLPSNADYSITVDSDGSLVLSGANLHFIRVSRDGQSRTDLTLPDQCQTVEAPILDDEHTTYFTSLYQNSLIAVRTNAGVKWTLTGAERIVTSPIVGPDGMVYTGFSTNNPDYGPGKNVPRNLRQAVAIQNDGSVRWIFIMEVMPAGFALAADGTLFTTAGNWVYALNTVDGSLKWQWNAASGVMLGPPVLDLDGTLYVPATGGLLVFDVASGPALSPWPMNRQNARQSACLQRGQAPQARMAWAQPGIPELELSAQDGAVILTGTSLRQWKRLGWQPASGQPVRWPLNTDKASGFYRVLPP